MPTKKDTVLSVRIPGDLDDRLKSASEKLDLSKNDIARHAIRAAVEAIEANDYRIEIPFAVEIKKSAVVSKPPVKQPKEMRAKPSGQPNVLCPGEKDMPPVQNVPMGPVIVSGQPTRLTREPNPLAQVQRRTRPAS